MSKLDKEFDEILKTVESLPPDEQDKILSNLLKDPLLSDLPQNATSDYVHNLIKLETGQLFEVYVIKETQERIGMIEYAMKLLEFLNFK